MKLILADCTDKTDVDFHIGQAPCLVNNQSDLSFDFDAFMFMINAFRPKPEKPKAVK